MFSGDEIPNEVIKAIQTEFDHQVMQRQVFANDVKRLFGEQSVDNLVALSEIFRQIAMNEDGALTAAYYDGICSSILTYVYELCPTCYSQHGPECLLDDISNDKEEG